MADRRHPVQHPEGTLNRPRRLARASLTLTQRNQRRHHGDPGSPIRRGWCPRTPGPCQNAYLPVLYDLVVEQALSSRHERIKKARLIIIDVMCRRGLDGGQVEFSVALAAHGG
jgi:hypothetical protein